MNVVLHDPETGHWTNFTSPHTVLQALNLPDVIPLLSELQRHIEHSGRLITPPVQCGLLNGTFRKE
jgi:hypothetical protein